MCDPFSITAGVLMVAGTAMAAKAQADTNKARASALGAEGARQDAFRSEAGGVFDRLLPGFGATAQMNKEGAAANSRQAAFRTNTVGGNTVLPSSASAPKVVASEASREGARAVENARITSDLLARMGARGEVAGANNIALNTGKQNIGVIANKAIGSLGILPLSLEAANHKADNLRMIADFTKAAGGASSMAGAAGVGPSFGSLFGRTPPNMITSGPLKGFAYGGV